MGKDRFLFFHYFALTAALGLSLKAFKSKNPTSLAPLVPISFSYAYQWDMYYGNKMQRIKQDAEQMIRDNPALFFPASNNLITSEEEYKEILQIKSKKKEN